MMKEIKGWKAEVQTDSSGRWDGNDFVFATKEEAEIYGKDLSSRWTLVREYRAIETKEAANYKMINGKAEPIKDSEPENPPEPEENEMILDALKPKTQEKKRRDPDHEQMNLF